MANLSPSTDPRPAWRKSLLLKLAIPAWIFYFMGAGMHTLGVQHDFLLSVQLGFGLVGVSAPLAFIGAASFFVILVGGRDPHRPEVHPYSLVGGSLGVVLSLIEGWAYLSAGSAPAP